MCLQDETTGECLVRFTQTTVCGEYKVGLDAYARRKMEAGCSSLEILQRFLLGYATKMSPKRFALAAASLVTLTTAQWPSRHGSGGGNDACSHIVHSFHYPDVTVNFATHIPAGTNILLSQAGVLATCDRPFQVVPVDLCRVAMFVKTSDISNITLEAWLPSNWTGRFLSTGNGGLSGCIQYEDIAYGTQLGFATVGANNGHNGTSGEPFYKNTEVVADFVYRSVHTGVVVGKAITEKFYGKKWSKSYYLGCSTGGRQGMKEVQDFPDDFDGVVAGAPAVAFNNLSSWSGSFRECTL